MFFQIIVDQFNRKTGPTIPHLTYFRNSVGKAKRRETEEVSAIPKERERTDKSASKEGSCPGR